MSTISGAASHPKKNPERAAARRRTISFVALFLFTSLLLAVPPGNYAQVAPDAESSPMAAGVAVPTLDQAVAIALQNNADVAGPQAQADTMWTVPSQAELNAMLDLLAGRLIHLVSPNLVVQPYQFVGADTLEVGADHV